MMNLSTCLNAADIHVLRTIARRQSLSCNLHSKHELMQSILEFFQHGREFDQHVARLTALQQNLLVRLALSKKQAYTREDLVVVAAKTIGEKQKQKQKGPEDLYRDLIDTGWLYQTTRETTPMYAIPDDLRGKVKEWYVNSLAHTLRFLPSQPAIYRDDHTAIIRDMLTFLHFVKEHDVRLTQDGSIFKRQQIQLFQLLEVQEQPVSGGWRFGYGRRFGEYPDRFALLYDFCYTKDWIREEADGSLQVTGIHETWFLQSDQDKLKELYEFWVQVYSKCIVQLSLAVPILVQACKDKWVYVNSLRDILKEYLEAYYYDSVDEVIEKRILQMLRCMGLLQVGQTTEEQQVIKLSKLGLQFFYPDAKSNELTASPQGAALLVQPNLEIVLTDVNQTRLDYELSCFADLVSTSSVRLYRMSPASIKRYIKAGHTFEQLQTFLQTNASAPIPKTVAQRVQQWFKEYGRIRSFQCVLIECEDENVREAVLEIPGIIARIEEVIGDRYLLVSEGQADRIVELLERAGKVVATDHQTKPNFETTRVH